MTLTNELLAALVVVQAVRPVLTLCERVTLWQARRRAVRVPPKRFL